MENYIENIENYLKGKLNPADQNEFEKELIQNDELREIVENYYDIKQAIYAGVESEAHQAVLQARAKMKENHQVVFPRLRKIVWWSAGVAALFLIFSLVYSNQYYPTTKIIQSAYHPPADLTKFMGAESTEKSQHLRAIWNQGEIQKALDFAKEWKQVDPSNTSIEYFLAHLYFQNNQYERANATFQNLLEDRRYAEDAEYHLALGQFMLGELDAAEVNMESIAKNSDNPFQKDAQFVLKKINSFWRCFVF